MASASQPELDTNLPGVRLLQEWIRVGLVLQLEMAKEHTVHVKNLQSNKVNIIQHIA